MPATLKVTHMAIGVEEGQVVAFRCSGKNILPVFLLSFVVPSLAISLRRE
jgi:hypothetical protein